MDFEVIYEDPTLITLPGEFNFNRRVHPEIETKEIEGTVSIKMVSENALNVIKAFEMLRFNGDALAVPMAIQLLQEKGLAVEGLEPRDLQEVLTEDYIPYKTWQLMFGMSPVAEDDDIPVINVSAEPMLVGLTITAPSLRAAIAAILEASNPEELFYAVEAKKLEQTLL